VGEKSPVNLGRSDTAVEAHLLEVDRADPAGGIVHLLEPGAEAEVNHPTAFEPTGPELDRAAGDGVVGITHSPAGLLAKVQRQDRIAGWGATGQRRPADGNDGLVSALFEQRSDRHVALRWSLGWRAVALSGEEQAIARVELRFDALFRLRAQPAAGGE
jgi:hypothetical protein